MNMDEQTIAKLAWELDNRWIHCDRRVLNISISGACGLALVAPDCIIFSKLLAPSADAIYDHCLN